MFHWPTSRQLRSLDEAERSPGSVRDLWLAKLDLAALGMRLSRFPGLRQLTLGWCDGAALPPEIERLPNLRELRVLNCPLKEFPVWLATSSTLRKLTLRGTE